MFQIWLPVFSLVLMTIHPSDSNPNVTKLHLLGLFPMTGPWAGGQAVLPATRLAVQDVNANPNVLPGYEIILIHKDTSVRHSFIHSFIQHKL